MHAGEFPHRMPVCQCENGNSEGRMEGRKRGWVTAALAIANNNAKKKKEKRLTLKNGRDGSKLGMCTAFAGPSPVNYLFPDKQLIAFPIMHLIGHSETQISQSRPSAC